VTLAARAGDLREHAPRPAAWPFLVVAPLTFTVQEHLERFAHDGAIPWTAVAEPTFLPGLLLTIPFGAAAYFATRLLLRVARALFVATAPPQARPVALVPLPRPRDPQLPRRSVLASSAATRGPPALR